MKKRNKYIALILAGALLSASGVPVYAAEDVAIEDVAIEDVSEEEIMDSEISEEQVARIKQSMENSVKITDEISKGSPSQNIMFSPTSLYFSLGMLAEGASGKTEEALEKFLGTDSYGEFAKKYIEFISERNSTEEDEKNGFKQKIKIANAIWADQGWELKKSFLDQTKEKYDAGVENLDFSDKGSTCEAINGWCDEQTEHLIPEIISPDMLSESSGLVLTNSLYFEAPWAGEAWSKTGVKEIFAGIDGEEEVEYMTSKGDRYFENEQAEAFSRSYQNGLQFVGILPKAEGDFCLEELDIAGLMESVPEYSTVDCKMPALDFTTTAFLNDILAQLGLSDLFTDGADFSNMSDTPAKVDTVIQKTNLQLDENGTKAAAVTGIMMEKCALMPEEPELMKEVVLDRPFAFMIYDEENQEVLFMGKVITSQSE